MLSEFETKNIVLEGYKKYRPYNDGWKKRLLIDRSRGIVEFRALKGTLNGGFRCNINNAEDEQDEIAFLVFLGSAIAMWCRDVDLGKTKAIEKKEFRCKFKLRKRGGQNNGKYDNNAHHCKDKK